jgi:hypothetical protein
LISAGGSCEYVPCPALFSDYPDDVTVYLVVNDYGQHGRAFVETDIPEADRGTYSQISSATTDVCRDSGATGPGPVAMF